MFVPANTGDKFVVGLESALLQPQIFVAAKTRVGFVAAKLFLPPKMACYAEDKSKVITANLSLRRQLNTLLSAKRALCILSQQDSISVRLPPMTLQSCKHRDRHLYLWLSMYVAAETRSLLHGNLTTGTRPTTATTCEHALYAGA